MIKPEVDRMVRSLEKAFEYSDKHEFPTEIWETLLMDNDVQKSLSNSSLDRLVVESVVNSNLCDLNPFSDAIDEAFDKLANILIQLCDKGVDVALSIITAGLAYYGYKERLLDSPIYNIQCNSDDTCVACLLNGRPPKVVPSGTGDNVIDVINILRQNMMSDTHFEQFVKDESQLVKNRLQNLTKLFPWAPLEESAREYPNNTPIDFGLSVQHLIDINKNISVGEITPVSTIAILDWLQPDRDIVFKSFGKGDYESFSVIGTFLTFVYNAIKKITLCDVTAIELTPMFKYLSESLMDCMHARLDNRYVQLVLMGINAMIASIEADYFHKYSDSCRELAKHLAERYNSVGSCEFSKQGICKHGVPDDMYEWMSHCLKSNVLPERVRNELSNATLYPMIGPVRLLFDGSYYGDDNQKSENLRFDSDDVCESMIRSLFNAVDPANVGSLRVDPVAGESGASDSWVETMSNPAVIEATLVKLHADNNAARKRYDLNDIAEIVAAQEAILKFLADPGTEEYIKMHILMENTRRDIVLGKESLRSYKNVPAFRSSFKEAEDNASERIRGIIKEL